MFTHSKSHTHLKRHLFGGDSNFGDALSQNNKTKNEMNLVIWALSMDDKTRLTFTEMALIYEYISLSLSTVIVHVFIWSVWLTIVFMLCISLYYHNAFKIICKGNHDAVCDLDNDDVRRIVCYAIETAEWNHKLQQITSHIIDDVLFRVCETVQLLLQIMLYGWRLWYVWFRSLSIANVLPEVWKLIEFRLHTDHCHWKQGGWLFESHFFDFVLS